MGKGEKETRLMLDFLSLRNQKHCRNAQKPDRDAPEASRRRRLWRVSTSKLAVNFYFLLFICFSIILLVGCQPKVSKSKPIEQQVKITGVSSGNTLNVIGIDSQTNLNSQVRLIGVDAPARRQRPWGEQSSRRLWELVGNKLVKLEFDVAQTDKFGRTLAYVWQDDILLNEQLVKEGHALFVPRSPNHKHDLRLERAQQFARLMGKGIWNPDKPMRLTPTEFRRIYR